MSESDAEGCMYSWRVRAVEAALAERGLSAGPLTVEQLTALGHLDQYHYYGTDACDEAIAVLGLDADRHVLDIGSGIGGPARYLAAETGCRVHGVEVRPELVGTARELTARTGLDDRVAFSADSAVSVALDDDRYDHLVAWLVLLHIDERVSALSNCRRALRPGGTAFVEALATDDPSPADRRALRDVVKMADPVSETGLVDQFHAAGFEEVVTCDLTEPWTRWTAVRYDRFRDRREQFVDLHGQATYERRVEFYRTVRDLFADGAVRGIRLTARVPGPDPLALDGRDQTTLSGRDPVAVLEGDSESS
jgi:cyclopropane fatty-acyl-phospholipid synthase-like methyltransferase